MHFAEMAAGDAPTRKGAPLFRKGAAVPFLAAAMVALVGLDAAGVGGDALPYIAALGCVGMAWLVATGQMSLTGPVTAAPAASSATPQTPETPDLAACLSEMQQANAGLRSALAATRAQLDLIRSERDDLAHQMTLDPLTGARNRRIIVSDFETNGPGTVMAVLDIDHFKKINDTLGHEVGDRVLRHFVRQLRTHFDDALPVYRIGGEEFVVMFPEGRMEEVAAALNAFRASLKVDVLTRMDDPVAVSFSAGLALYSTEAESFDDVFKVADDQLYDAKMSGRARTVWPGIAPRHEMAIAA